MNRVARRRAATGCIPAVDQADLGRDEHTALLILTALRVDRVQRDLVDAKRRELRPDPFPELVVQVGHPRPFGHPYHDRTSCEMESLSSRR